MQRAFERPRPREPCSGLAREEGEEEEDEGEGGRRRVRGGAGEGGRDGRGMEVGMEEQENVGKEDKELGR